MRLGRGIERWQLDLHYKKEVRGEVKKHDYEKQNSMSKMCVCVCVCERERERDRETERETQESF
jgi:hypothetical protein